MLTEVSGISPTQISIIHRNSYYTFSIIAVCEDAPDLKNGTVSEYTGRVVGDKVTYECNEGFGFGPGSRMSRTCKEDRFWTTENIYCVLGQIAMMHMLLL